MKWIIHEDQFHKNINLISLIEQDKNMFKKYTTFGMAFLIIGGSVLLSGCFNNTGDINNVNNQSQTVSQNQSKDSVINNQKCEEEYNRVLTKNKQSFNDCKFNVTNDEFQGEEVKKKQNNTVLIFDASGSMAGKVDGKRKIDIAKEAVSKFISQLQGSDVNLSVIVYGHKGNNSGQQKAISCAGIEEIYYMGSVESNVVNGKINPLQPTGWTPIADSLSKAENILSKYAGDNNVNSIILVSDGKETCGGDPVAKARQLQKSNLNVIINVIGFDVGGEDERQLQDVAKSGGGDYFSVKNAIDFDYAFKKHKAFMKEFDYKIKNVQTQLKDIGSFGEKYFKCLMRLRKQEAGVMLDTYAEENFVDEKCQAFIESKYYQEVFNPMDTALKNSFDQTMKKWHEASAFKKDN